MPVNNVSLSKTLGKLFACILLLVVCVTLAICAVGDHVWLYIGVRALFFLLVALTAFSFRKNVQAVLSKNEPRRKMVMAALLLVAAVSFCLHAADITPRIFYTITYSLSIYDLPLFWAFLWEELFLGDLYWSILLSLVILCARRPALGTSHAIQAG